MSGQVFAADMTLLGLAVEQDASIRSRSHCGYGGIVSVENGDAVPGERIDQLSLGRRDGAHRSQALQMYRPDIGDDADLGARDPAQQVDLAGAVHRHLKDGALVLRLEPEKGERQADLSVEVGLALQDAPARAQDGGDELLAGGLAHAAGDTHDADVMAGPPVSRQPLQCR